MHKSAAPRENDFRDLLWIVGDLHDVGSSGKQTRRASDLSEKTDLQVFDCVLLIRVHCCCICSCLSNLAESTFAEHFFDCKIALMYRSYVRSPCMVVVSCRVHVTFSLIARQLKY